MPAGITVSDVVIPRNIKLLPRFDEELLSDSIVVLEGKAEFAEGWSNQLYREVSPRRLKEVEIKLIPYYTWCNRGISEMTVWLPLDW